MECLSFFDNTEHFTNDDGTDHTGVSVSDKKIVALHLMHCTHSMSLSHSSVDNLCISSETLLKEVSSRISDEVQDLLTKHSIDSPALLRDIKNDSIFDDSIFDSLGNRHSRERYSMKKNLVML